jgi:deazaflavin-dependent oxidoreductase (nitroreductase family)
VKTFYRYVVKLYENLYRLSGGLIGGRIVGLPVLLLTTTGRKSGKLRTRPLCYFPDGNDYIIIASNGGSDSHPSWYHNIRVNPNVSILIKRNSFAAVASQASEPERGKLWAHLIKLSPWYLRYERRTERVIPLIRLRAK